VFLCFYNVNTPTTINLFILQSDVYLDAATITVFVFFAFDFFVSAKLEKGYLFSLYITPQ